MSHPTRDRRGQLGPVVRKDLSRLASKQALVEGTCYRTGAVIVATIPSTYVSLSHTLSPYFLPFAIWGLQTKMIPVLIVHLAVSTTMAFSCKEDTT